MEKGSSSMTKKYLTATPAMIQMATIAYSKSLDGAIATGDMKAAIEAALKEQHSSKISEAMKKHWTRRKSTLAARKASKENLVKARAVKASKETENNGANELHKVSEGILHQESNQKQRPGLLRGLWSALSQI
jgi:hypothetical protein